MSILHTLTGYAKDYLVGAQTSRRDWSPYLVHFTSQAAMKSLQSAIKKGMKPRQIKAALDGADEASFAKVRSIWESSELRISSPSAKGAKPKCLCLSECSLPGLISHAERYGRFGFVFDRQAIAEVGGAPCLYLLRKDYEVLKAIVSPGRDARCERIWGLANLVEPVGMNRGKPQDFTHEREWRVFEAIDLKKVPPVCLLAPSAYVARVRDLGLEVPVIPLDTLHAWGA